MRKVNVPAEHVKVEHVVSLLKFLNLLDPNKFGCQRRSNHFMVAGQ